MSTSLVRSAKKKGKAVDRNSSQEDVKIVRKKTRRARESVSETKQYIPGTVVHDILVKISANFVHNFRLVNKECRNLISRRDFIAQNFKHSEPQLIIQCPTSAKRTYFDIKVTKFNDKTHVCQLSDFDLPETGLVRPSCYGLLLTNVPNQPGILRVVNPVTKKHFTLPLPRFPSYCPHRACAAALVFDPLGKVFKVVHMYTSGVGFEILTLLDGQEIGCKKVFVKWSNGPVPNPLFKWRDPLLSDNGRVLHWNIQSNEYILSMDIVEEKPVLTLIPNLGLRLMTVWRYILLEMDGCVAAVFYDSIAIFSVWVLKDFRAGLWEQRDYIRRENIKFADYVDVLCPPLNELVPVGGFENGRYLVFKHDETDDGYGGGLFLYIYDMKTREMKDRYKVNKKMKNMESLFTYRSSLYHWNTFRDEQVNTD